MNALWRIGRRFFTRDPWQLGLAILGIALGIAVVVAIDLASGSASRAFDSTIEAIGGRATHRIVGGPRGVPEGIYARLRTELGIQGCAPVIRATARVLQDRRRGMSLELLGVDPFAEAPLRPWLAFGDGAQRFELAGFLGGARGVVLSGTTASELGVVVGDRLEIEVDGRASSLRLVGELDPSDPTVRSGLARVAIADVASVQEIADRVGFLDRIDLRLESADQESAIRGALPDGLILEVDPRRAGVLEDLTRAFRLNLQALGLLALLVGAFLIHNTMQFAVVRRRTQIGVLRAIGATRAQVFFGIVAESLTIGAVGTLLGIALGIGLAHALVDLVVATVRDFYFTVAVSTLEVGAPTLLAAGVLGLVVSAVAAIAPAIEATRAEPRAVLLRAELEARVSRGALRAVPVGLALGLVGVLALIAGARGVVTAYAAIFAVLIGVACLVPQATVVLLRVARWPLGRLAGSVGRWASRGAEAALSRTAIATAALTLAVATTVGLGVMIASFRSTVAVWLDTTLGADVYTSVPGSLSSRTEHRIDPEAVERLRRLPELGSLSTYRRVQVATRRGPVELAAVEVAPQTPDTLSMIAGGEAEMREALTNGDALLITEPLAFRLSIGVGDEIELRTDRGWRALEIEGVFRDYASERGYALIARHGYDVLFDDTSIASIAMWAADGVTPETLLSAAEAAIADVPQHLSVRSNRALRDGSLEVFDRTFAITDVLRLLCVIVAFVGVWSALTAMQLERGREMGVLRAMGATPRQVTALLTVQNGLLGLCAGLLALPTGVLLAWLLIDVVNRRSFGWTLLSVELSPVVLVQAVVIAVVAAVLAGVIPSWRLARVSPSEVLRSE